MTCLISGWLQFLFAEDKTGCEAWEIQSSEVWDKTQ